MSRSGYNDSCEGLDLIRYRGRVTAAIRGRRGQAMLRDLLAALDAVPGHRLIAGELAEAGEVCALGALGLARQVDMAALDPYDAASVAATFDIAEPLAREIAYENDGDAYWMRRSETPEQRWQRMRDWVASKLAPPTEKETTPAGGRRDA